MLIYENFRGSKDFGLKIKFAELSYNPYTIAEFQMEKGINSLLVFNIFLGSNSE